MQGISYDLASINFIQGIFTLESGPMTRVMGVEFILTRIGVDKLVNQVECQA